MAFFWHPALPTTQEDFWLTHVCNRHLTSIDRIIYICACVCAYVCTRAMVSSIYFFIIFIISGDKKELQMYRNFSPKMCLVTERQIHKPQNLSLILNTCKTNKGFNFTFVLFCFAFESFHKYLFNSWKIIVRPLRSQMNVWLGTTGGPI